MTPGQFSGSYLLFRFLGIRVYLHWSWFIAAAVLVQMRARDQNLGESGADALLHILALFGIVLLHEFGHALACRSVGGEARTIVLWPMGGVAFVRPPPRPGPVLWSIAAGPLVNVALVPLTMLLLGLFGLSPFSIRHWAASIFWVNLMLLCFNMLPIYPLDGGQILQALLWFVLGRSWSLRISAAAGLAAALAGGVVALRLGHTWLVVMAAFLAWQAYNGLRYARQLSVVEPVQGWQREGESPR